MNKDKDGLPHRQGSEALKKRRRRYKMTPLHDEKLLLALLFSSILYSAYCIPIYLLCNYLNSYELPPTKISGKVR